MNKTIIQDILKNLLKSPSCLDSRHEPILSMYMHAHRQNKLTISIQENAAYKNVFATIQESDSDSTQDRISLNCFHFSTTNHRVLADSESWEDLHKLLSLGASVVA